MAPSWLLGRRFEPETKKHFVPAATEHRHHDFTYDVCVKASFTADFLEQSLFSKGSWNSWAYLASSFPIFGNAQISNAVGYTIIAYTNIQYINVYSMIT